MEARAPKFNDRKLRKSCPSFRGSGLPVNAVLDRAQCLGSSVVDPRRGSNDVGTAERPSAIRLGIGSCPPVRRRTSSSPTSGLDGAAVPWRRRGERRRWQEATGRPPAWPFPRGSPSPVWFVAPAAWGLLARNIRRPRRRLQTRETHQSTRRGIRASASQ